MFDIKDIEIQNIAEGVTKTCALDSQVFVTPSGLNRYICYRSFLSK